MEAPTTFLGRIPRVYQDNGNSCHLSLVRNVLPQLAESPVGKLCSLPTSGLNPSAYACEFFQANRGFGALRRLYNSFRDLVIDVFLVSGLLAGNLAKLALGSLRALALEIAPAVREDTAFPFNFGTAIYGSVRIGCEVDNPQVNTQNILNTNCVRVWNFANASNVENPANQHQVYFALAVFQKLSLPFTTLKGDCQPTAQCPDRDSIARLEAKDTIIIRLRRMLAEFASSLFVKLVGIRHLGNTTYCYLRRQTKLFAASLIGYAMQLELPKGIGLPCLLGQPVARSISCLKCQLERFVLLATGEKFDVCYQFHAFKYRGNREKTQENCSAIALLLFLPVLNDGVSTKGVLMIYRWTVLLLPLLLFVLPAHAFVERLVPNTGASVEGIPCHTMRAVIVEFINGTFSAAQLGNELSQKYLCGADMVCTGGEGWTAQDNTDNADLVTLINGQSASDKILTALRVESLCVLWERGKHPAIDSPAEFRTLLGLTP